MMKREDWVTKIIAQDDDEDYDESGWVCWQDGETYFLARYGHCSCYTTFTSLTGGGISSDHQEGEPSYSWTGTQAELIDMARAVIDPDMPGRNAMPDDCDFDHLVEMYRQVLAYFNAQPDAADIRH